MQNNLKSVMFFRKVFKVFFCILFFCFVLRHSCRQIASPVCRAMLSLTGFNLRVIYYRPGTPVLFKVFFCIPFCSYASLYFCSISDSEYNMLNIFKKKNFFCGQICDKKRHDHLANLHKKNGEQKLAGKSG